MDRAKANIFSPSTLRKARLAKALGHPVRIAIIEYLLCNDRCSSGILTREISLSQSTLAQHLKQLRDVGLLDFETRGKETSFFINKEVWKQVEIRILQSNG